MAVRQRGSSWQGDFRFNGQRVRDTFDSMEAAEKWVKDSTILLTKGEAVIVNGKVVMKVEAATDSAVTNLARLVQYTYDLEWAGTKNSKTALGNARDVAKRLGDTLHPGKVDGRAILGLVAALKTAGNSNGTINRKLSALKRMLEIGKVEGCVKQVPDFKPFWREEATPRDRFYSPEEERSILDYFERHEDRDMRDLCIALVDTGCRLSEALGWAWRDIPKIMDGEAIRVWASERKNAKGESDSKGTKNAKSKSVFQTIRLAAMLASRKAACPVGESRVFWNLTRSTCENRWDDCRKDLKMDHDPDFVMHTFRHTFASRLAMAGVDPLKIKAAGGWKTLAMVERYSHLRPDNISDLRKLLPAGYNPFSGAKSDDQPVTKSVTKG